MNHLRRRAAVSQIIDGKFLFLNKMCIRDRAFVDFVLSEDGQALTAEIGYTPVKSGVAVPEGFKSIDEITPLSWDTEELYQNREADKEQFSQMFQ